jgi:hypothetical protein
MASIAKAGAAQGWLLGYITATAGEYDLINRAIHQTDSDGLQAWVDSWCRANPLRSIAQAANALAFHLNRENLN